MNKIILATDLDKTLLGDSVALGRLNELLDGLRKNNELKLVYVTARSIESYNKLILTEPLLTPDALITSIGTEIRLEQEMERMTGWPNAKGWNVDFANTQLDSLPGLIKQPVSEQREYKVSYYLDVNYPSLQKVKAVLGDTYEVIYSGIKYLDVLPKGVHKGSAIQYLSDSWGIDYHNIVACGDSANDISMIDGNKSIIVGNAQQGLLDWLDSSNQPQAYLAAEHYASGIVEGLRHFGII